MPCGFSSYEQHISLKMKTIHPFQIEKETVQVSVELTLMGQTLGNLMQIKMLGHRKTLLTPLSPPEHIDNFKFSVMFQS